MRNGVTRETEPSQGRVALLPKACAGLIGRGHGASAQQEACFTQPPNR